MINSNLNRLINSYNNICPDGTWKISENDRQSLRALLPTVQSIATTILDKECDQNGSFVNYAKSTYKDIADCKVQAGYSYKDSSLVNVFVKLPQVAAGGPNEIVPGSIKKVDRCYQFAFKRSENVETPQLESFKPLARVKFNMQTTRPLEQIAEQFTNEMIILTSLSHRNILSLIEGYSYVGTRKEADGAKEPFDKIVLFQELFACDMFTELQQELLLLKTTQRLNKAKPLLFQLIDAVTYLHSKEIAHCDLKFENVFLKKLLDDNRKIVTQLVLGDFEMAVPFDQKTCPKGTLMAIAPEILKNLDEMKVPVNDVWALGCMLLILKEKNPPLWSGLIDLFLGYGKLSRSLKEAQAKISKNIKKVGVVSSPLSPSKRNIDNVADRSSSQMSSVSSLAKRKNQEDQASPTQQNKQSKSHLDPFNNGLKGLLLRTNKINATNIAQLDKLNSDAARSVVAEIDYINSEFQGISRSLSDLIKQGIGSNIEALEKLIETLEQLHTAHERLLDSTWENLQAIEAPYGAQPTTYEQTFSYLIWGMLRPDPKERITMQQASDLLAQFRGPVVADAVEQESQPTLQHLPLEPISTEVSDCPPLVGQPVDDDMVNVRTHLIQPPDFFEPRPAKVKTIK